MFQDAPLNSTGGSPFSELYVKLSPQSGEIKDFDFDFSLESDDLSAGTSSIKFEGTGLYDGKEFSFSGPISKFNLKYGLGTKHNYDFNYDAIVFEQKDYTLDIGSIEANIPDDAKS